MTSHETLMSAEHCSDCDLSSGGSWEKLDLRESDCDAGVDERLMNYHSQEKRSTQCTESSVTSSLEADAACYLSARDIDCCITKSHQKLEEPCVLRTECMDTSRPSSPTKDSVHFRSCFQSHVRSPSMVSEASCFESFNRSPVLNDGTVGGQSISRRLVALAGTVEQRIEAEVGAAADVNTELEILRLRIADYEQQLKSERAKIVSLQHAQTCYENCRPESEFLSLEEALRMEHSEKQQWYDKCVKLEGQVKMLSAEANHANTQLRDCEDEVMRLRDDCQRLRRANMQLPPIVHRTAAVSHDDRTPLVQTPAMTTNNTAPKEWICSNCTRLNRPSFVFCEICNTPRLSRTVEC